MAYINGQKIPFVYKAEATSGEGMVASGVVTMEGGEIEYDVHLNFSPTGAFVKLLTSETPLANNDMTFAMKAKSTDGFFYFCIDNNDTYSSPSLNYPILLMGNRLKFYPSTDPDSETAAFGAGNRYEWVAYKKGTI